ncbi:sensor domain-containing diguanylate cyclase [Solibacillus sp. MA9]|uniref:Sensor domain-containing diguanylate cyclase n=1 Tax=Solibacillus palustris TaxID=2908203 RepID=A0ABS9UE69_9BACL|nr:sensor domain-containing diguanylate cyclase [Solibacillus sp. MA9]MCH7322624.1 sensor domain-containing diguanylate cyclase [Solibacillus sp. MA9]
MSSVFSVEQFELLFGKSHDAVFFMEKVNEDYRYVHVNEVAKKLINMEPTGKFVGQVVSPHIAKNILQNYNLTLQNCEQVDFEDYTYAEMEVRKQRTSTIPIIEADKQYILAITKEVHLSRDMEDKYLFMRSVFLKSFLSTILISNEMCLIEADPKFADDFNLRPEIMKGKTIFDIPFVDEKTAPHLREYLQLAQKGENITSKMLHLIDKNGQTRHYSATFSSLTSNDEIFAVFIILQEITSLIKQGQALKTASHGLETFKNAISSVADVLFTSIDGTILDVNERVLKNTGYQREELIGHNHRIFNSGHHEPEFFVKLWDTIKNGYIWRNDVCNRKKNGDIYWMDMTIIPLKNIKGEIEQFLSIHYNISSEKRLMSELYKIEQTFRAITENTNDFIVITNQSGEIKYASPSYMRKLGYRSDELIGLPYECLLTSDSIDTWRDVIEQPQHSAIQEQKIELQLRSKFSGDIWTEGNYTISLELMEQEVAEIVMVSREITERKELETRLTYLAYHDSLTQLGNRRKLYKEFPKIEERAKVSQTSIAIFYLDGDNFKRINDQYGHDVGDEFLKCFGQSIVSSVRHDDLVIRLGGDEFLIVVTGLSLEEFERMEQIQHIIDRIKTQLAIGWKINNVHFSPTITIGISIFPDHSSSLDELIDLADQALYEAKQKSRNSFRLCQESQF